MLATSNGIFRRQPLLHLGARSSREVELIRTLPVATQRALIAFSEGESRWGSDRDFRQCLAGTEEIEVPSL